MMWIGFKTNSTHTLPSIFNFSKIFQEEIIEGSSRVKVWLIQLPNFSSNLDFWRISECFQKISKDKSTYPEYQHWIQHPSICDSSHPEVLLYNSCFWLEISCSLQLCLYCWSKWLCQIKHQSRFPPGICILTLENPFHDL